MTSKEMENLVNNFCIVIAGTISGNDLGTNERQVFNKAQARLTNHGWKLIREEVAQLKYYRLKDDLEQHKRICAEDGIDLGIGNESRN